MKRIFNSVLLFAFGILCASAITVFSSQSKVEGQTPPLTNNYIVVAKNKDSVSDILQKAVTDANGQITHKLSNIGLLAVKSDNPNFYAELKTNPEVEFVSEDVEVNWLPNNENNNLYTESSVPQELNAISLPANREPFGYFQWNLRQINADKTAANGDRGNTVVRARVAVLDGGIVTNHEDIAPNLNIGLSKSFVPGEPVDFNGQGFSHGTHVAGIIAAPINGKGIQGVAPNAEIVAVKVLNDTGSGSFSSIIAGIEYASSPEVNADVINMSLGATFDRINAGGDGVGPLLAGLNRAVNHATKQGTLVVSAAGNNNVNLNSRIATIPAQSGNGMAVSATGPIGFANYGNNAIFDRLASYSNYGQSVINVAAPGGDATLVPQSGWFQDMVLSPGGTGNRYSFSAGTSMAAPHVAGLAALIIGKNGHMQPSQLQALIQKSADDILKPGIDPETGNGRINALKALQTGQF